MLGILKDRSGTNLIRGAAGRNDQRDVVIPFKDLGNSVMQEADADDALTDANLLGRTGTGLGVLLDVLVEFNEVLHRFVVTLHLNHRVDDQLCRTSDQALVLGLEQIIPVLRRFDRQTGKLLGIDHESQDALIDAIPVSIRIPVILGGQVNRIFCLICLKHSGRSHLGIRIIRAAKPDIRGGISVFLGDLGLNLTGGKTLIAGLDAKFLFKLLARSRKVCFLTGAINDQFAVFLCCGHQVRIKISDSCHSHCREAHGKNECHYEC